MRPYTTGHPIALSNPSVAEWFNTDAFILPPAGQFGDASRNSIIGPGTLLFDMALTRLVPMKDNRMLELRVSAANVFNRPQLTSIDTIVNSPTFGRVTAAGPMRTLQLTARFRF